MKHFLKSGLFLLIAIGVGSLEAIAGNAAGSGQLEDTMLMFVGEELDVLSIASRREESALQAPAVAGVITRNEISERGARTLKEALENEPGFYMAQKEGGTLPYLRSIPNSVLFLYDTVPVMSDTTKSLHQLDSELSLAPVKRIEIIRGPGSVLWGPDAFAGIVNVVTMTGKDLEGFETGISYESPRKQKSFFVNYGHDAGRWDGFVSLSGRKGEEDDPSANVARFWESASGPAPPEVRYGNENPGDAQYLDVFGKFSLGDQYTLSARASPNEKPYTMTNAEGDLSWVETRKAPLYFLKFEGRNDIGMTSAIRFTGYYTLLNPEYEIIDRSFEQKEKTLYGEGIYDRSFFAGRGLFTGGLSYRDKRIDDALVWEDYFPEMLGPENENFLPRVSEKDYHSALWSAFGQYSQKIGEWDGWLGLRFDNHDEYKDHFSFSTGVSWQPAEDWILKLLYGTAYRTPFARQLLEDEEPDLEKIKSVNLHAGWKPAGWLALSAVGFYSKIDNHIFEDPYAGLSLASHQDFYGMEMEVDIKVTRELSLAANFTLTENSGPDQIYNFNDFTFVRPDGTVVKHFVHLKYPYDTGAKDLFNLIATWNPFERVTTSLRLGCFSSRRLIFPRGEGFESFSGQCLLDATLRVKDIFVPGLDLSVIVKNLTDNFYETPGTYHAIQGDPFTIEFGLQKTW
jgi:outer membrane receptor protein involved in Fe transport